MPTVSQPFTFDALNFTMMPARTQGFGPKPLATAALLLVACSGPRSLAGPASPEAAVRSFLNAVRANSLTAMSEVWGSARGPASSYMRSDELEQRLTIIRTYLEHESFEILESQAALPAGSDGRRSLQVRLTRRGCTPVVRFAVVPYGGGWLVSDIDLSAVGNPQRRCSPQDAGGRAGNRELESAVPAFTR
ncbi:MAG: hypothetical protein A3K13_10370 [Gemmatimonadetes bacterium RIFCSPLOWO2_12_FULL_68_9]|nr:MAG: hypothetical protein A3K13_10370 [Gemmatimonadetes bacterium RIFCSPLOWO2_12_FULL_68_9]